MDAMLGALKPVLSSAGKVARVYYAGACEGQDRLLPYCLRLLGRRRHLRMKRV